MRTILAGALLLLTAANCSHLQSDLTAAEHRNEAAILTSRAQQQQAEAPPPDNRALPMMMPNISDIPEERVTTYAPNDAYLARADADLRAANAHLAAAKKLEAFEAQACRGLSVGEKSACPLLASSVAQVRHTAAGFQLVMKPGVDVAKTSQMLTCHLAYAETTGFDRPSCPLFMKGSSIERVGETIIEFKGSSPNVAADLQGQAQRVFRGTAGPI
jgi:hypothetical protein